MWAQDLQPERGPGPLTTSFCYAELHEVVQVTVGPVPVCDSGPLWFVAALTTCESHACASWENTQL